MHLCMQACTYAWHVVRDIGVCHMPRASSEEAKELKHLCHLLDTDGTGTISKARAESNDNGQSTKHAYGMRLDPVQKTRSIVFLRIQGGVHGEHGEPDDVLLHVRHRSGGSDSQSRDGAT